MIEMISESFHTATPFTHIILRMLAACALGFVIGFERERRGRSAGLRTNMLTSLAACVFALIALEMIAALGSDDDRTQMDPIRVVEAVTAGVAFLAAGAIIQSRGDVRGLTTGAGMWLSGAVGLACGAGYIAISIVAVLIALIILAPLRFIEEKFIEPDSGSNNSDTET